MPHRTTPVTKHHKVRYMGKMVEAQELLTVPELAGKVKKVAYGGEILYNVLLDRHSSMRVHGLVFETLDPQNYVAQLFLNRYNSNKISTKTIQTKAATAATPNHPVISRKPCLFR
jgi:hypothetical protein